MKTFRFFLLTIFCLILNDCGPLDSFSHNDKDISALSTMTDANRDFLVELAKKYAPLLRQHPDEKFPLANADWFLQNAGLMQVKDGKEVELIPPGKVTIDKLKNLTIDVKGKKEPVMRKTGTEGDIDTLKLFIPKNNYSNVQKGAGAKPVCYAFPRFVDEGKAIEIAYMFFNAYNGTVGSNIPLVTPVLDTLGVGHHEGDWEHISVRLDPTGQKIAGIFYATHGSTEGKWHRSPNTNLTSSDGYKLKDGQPVTWSTLDTHGNHNYAGTIKREPPSAFKAIIKTLGLLVEKTSDKGKQYDCRQMLEIFTPDDPSKNHPWLDFRGRWGGKVKDKSMADERGPDGPAFKDWWRKEERWTF